jgi:hypothetical protein
MAHRCNLAVLGTALLMTTVSAATLGAKPQTVQPEPIESLIRREKQEMPPRGDTMMQIHSKSHLSLAASKPVSRKSHSAKRSKNAGGTWKGQVPKIPGHLAFINRTSLVAVSHKDCDCEETLGKAEHLTDAVRTYKTDLDVTHTDGSTESINLDSLKAELESRASVNAGTRHKYEQVLNHLLDNTSALNAAGVTWLDVDANVFTSCCDGNPAVCTRGDGSLITEHPFVSQTGPQFLQLEQGDMAVPKSAHPSHPASAQSLFEATMQHRRVVTNTWPVTSGTTHTINYCFASTVSQDVQTAINDAVLHIEQQVECVKFNRISASSGTNSFAEAVQENCVSQPSLIIQSSEPGCWSLVGKWSGSTEYSSMSQPVNVGSGCESMGICAHEIGHSLGMLHEMSRADQATYLTVHTGNIKNGYASNFDPYSSADTETSFDFLSLMMYGAYSFSTNSEMTIQPQHLELVNFMGQRVGFSELDVELIGRLYGCSDKVTPQTPNRALSETYLTQGANMGFTGECVDSIDSETGFVVPGTTTDMSCLQLKTYCSHDTQGETVRSKCPVTCYMCTPGGSNSTSSSSSTNSNSTEKSFSTRQSPELFTSIILIVASFVSSRA